MNIFRRMDAKRSRNSTRRSLLTAFTTLLATVGSMAVLPTLSVWAAAVDVCIPNVAQQLNDLKHHGEALGFHRGDSPDPTNTQHYQSIQRLSSAGRPTFFVSRNGNPVFFGSAQPGNLLVVRLDSRQTHGERVRSNKLRKGVRTPSTVPPTNDRVVRTVTFDGTFLNGVRLPRYAHVGGMQLVGDILAVALEHPLTTGLPSGMIMLFDVSNPLSPVVLHKIALSHKAGGVALSRHASRWLMLVIGPDDNRTLRAYQSNRSNLRDPATTFQFVDLWNRSELPNPLVWPTGSTGMQTINLIRQCNGRLFLLGNWNSLITPGVGTDYISLFEVSLAGSPRRLALTFVSRKHRCNGQWPFRPPVGSGSWSSRPTLI